MKDIPWYEWRYAITEDGRVWSHSKYWRNGKFLKEWYSVYVNVSLPETKSVHRLVALAYIPNPNNYPIVRHLDNNKYNNHVSNLEWCTHSTNTKQAVDDWLWKASERLKNTSKAQWLKMAKPIMQLTNEGILCRIYNSAREACKITGICYPNISRCVTWRRKYAWGYIWQFIK